MPFMAIEIKSSLSMVLIMPALIHIATFCPLKNKFEVAIIGDSYIEGFHQDYTKLYRKKN